MVPEGFKAAFKAVQARYQTLCMEVWFAGPYAGEVYEQERYKGSVDMVLSVLALKKDARLRVEEALAPYYGKALTLLQLEEMAWRCAAGYERFKRGEPIFNEFFACETHWVPLVIEHVEPAKPSQQGNPQVDVSMRIYDGPFSGLLFRQPIVYGVLTRMIAGDIGWPRFGKVYPAELVQCWMAGELNVTNPKYPRVDEYAPTHAAISHNRALRKLRAEPCPEGYDWACHQCPVGYDGTGACLRATHRYTYVTRPCPGCHKEATYFDPESVSHLCVGCRASMLREQLKASRFK